LIEHGLTTPPTQCSLYGRRDHRRARHWIIAVYLTLLPV